MNVLQAVVLGLVQGFAEFLPISSSGHLVLAQRMFGLTEQMSFDIILHLGSLVAVFAVYWEDIWGLLKKPFQNLTYMLIAATVPAVAVGLLLKGQIESLFEGGLFLALSFIITGLLLLYSDSVPIAKKGRGKDVGLVDALVIGCVQAAAIAPGISRSGSTITAGLHQRLSRAKAARFSFLLSIPAILGAAVLTTKDVQQSEGASGVLSIGALPIAMGFLAAMLSGYISIRFMIDLIGKCRLKYFAYYVFILAAFILVDCFALHKFF